MVKNKIVIAHPESLNDYGLLVFDMAFGRSMGDSDLNLYSFWYLVVYNTA